jgi:hypothetical protein
VSDLVLDASLALQWFLEDEADRKYSLNVLSSLSEKQAVVPVLWFYEVGNGLLMAYRRKRIGQDQIDGFLTRLKRLPPREQETRNGAPGGTRTPDLLVRSQTLYPTELRARSKQILAQGIKLSPRLPNTSPKTRAVRPLQNRACRTRRGALRGPRRLPALLPAEPPRQRIPSPGHNS